MKDKAYVIIFNERKSIGIHWITLHANGYHVKYFDSFRVNTCPKK